MKKRILPMIIILEIVMIFVMVVLKRDYTYGGYAFHLDDVNLYSVSGGESFLGEKLTVMPDGSVEFRKALYKIRMSGHKDNGFQADIYLEGQDGEFMNITGIALDKREEAEVVRNFIWAVYARNSPIAIVWIFLLDLIGWILIKSPGLPFFVLYSWKVKEELHPSENFLKITRCLGYAAYILGIYLTCRYLFI